MDKEVRLLVVGSLVMDMTVNTKRFPGTGETVLGTDFHMAPGGKGANQALQAARLGAKVTMIGRVGGDIFGQELLKPLKQAGVAVEHITVDDTSYTAVGSIVLEETPDGKVHNRIIVAPGANMNVRPSDISFLEKEISVYDMVLLQLEIPLEVNEAVARIAKRAGVPVMLNPAPSAALSDSFISNLTFISPNEHEVADLTGIQIRRGEDGSVVLSDAKAAADALLARGVKNVIITLGGSGAVFASASEFIFEPAETSVELLDPTAAGDSFVGSFCTAYCRGMSVREAMVFGNCAAAITVSGKGAQPSLPHKQAVDLIIRDRMRRLSILKEISHA